VRQWWQTEVVQPILRGPKTSRLSRMCQIAAERTMLAREEVQHFRPAHHCRHATVLGNALPSSLDCSPGCSFAARRVAFWLACLAVSGSVLIVWRTSRATSNSALRLMPSALAPVLPCTHGTEEVRAHTSTLVFLRLACSQHAALLLHQFALESLARAQRPHLGSLFGSPLHPTRCYLASPMRSAISPHHHLDQPARPVPHGPSAVLLFRETSPFPNHRRSSCPRRRRPGHRRHIPKTKPTLTLCVRDRSASTVSSQPSCHSPEAATH